MVNILKNVDLTQWQRGSAKVLHYITEAKRLAGRAVRKSAPVGVTLNAGGAAPRRRFLLSDKGSPGVLV